MQVLLPAKMKDRSCRPLAGNSSCHWSLLAPDPLGYESNPGRRNMRGKGRHRCIRSRRGIRFRE
eukprot:3899323-Pyramimonas_sp.AAC.1